MCGCLQIFLQTILLCTCTPPVEYIRNLSNIHGRHLRNGIYSIYSRVTSTSLSSPSATHLALSQVSTRSHCFLVVSSSPSTGYSEYQGNIWSFFNLGYFPLFMSHFQSFLLICFFIVITTRVYCCSYYSSCAILISPRGDPLLLGLSLQYFRFPSRTHDIIASRCRPFQWPDSVVARHIATFHQVQVIPEALTQGG